MVQEKMIVDDEILNIESHLNGVIDYTLDIIAKEEKVVIYAE